MRLSPEKKMIQAARGYYLNLFYFDLWVVHMMNFKENF